MDTPEVVLAVIGGTLIAALLCWTAVRVALGASRRSGPGARHAPGGGNRRGR